MASKMVHCELTGQNDKKQTIDCNALDMRTARSDDGKVYARQVNASGAVHAFDADQDLRAGFVDLTLKPAMPTESWESDDDGEPDSDTLIRPATRPANDGSDTAPAELEKMVARDQVQVTNKEGSRATGSELVITTESGVSHVRLTGSPLATVTDARKNVIAGPLILVEPKTGVAHIIGPGNMHVLQESRIGSPKPRPMDVAWIDRADMNGPADRIDILGGVIVKTLDADGTHNTVTGDRVRIDLLHKLAPATQAATQATTRLADTRPVSPSTRPARHDAVASSMQMDVLKDKEVRTITIEGNGKVESSLAAANGTIARQFSLWAPRIIYQLIGSSDSPGKTMIVPTAGQMLVRDHRPSDKHPAPDKPKKQDDEAGSRGDTAFQWKKRLVYSETDRRAVMTGDVVIVHQPDGKESADGPLRINADQVTATFDPRKPDTRAVATTLPAQQEPAMQLKRLTADGHIIITRGPSSLSSEKIDYDPLTHWMTAHGTDEHPAFLDDPDPRRSLVARDLQWNTQTWNIKMTGPLVTNPK